ncbi:hypothetical protein HZA33_03540 [Candidatus Pacearchaeota archaeon]|nr:hypothetical protein [Candidatus Pacearchaeota archaeon]
MKKRLNVNELENLLSFLGTSIGREFPEIEEQAKRPRDLMWYINFEKIRYDVSTTPSGIEYDIRCLMSEQAAMNHKDGMSIWRPGPKEFYLKIIRRKVEYLKSQIKEKGVN